MSYPCKACHSALRSSMEVLFHTSAVYFSRSRADKIFLFWFVCFLFWLVNKMEPADHTSLGCWMAEGYVILLVEDWKARFMVIVCWINNFISSHFSSNPVHFLALASSVCWLMLVCYTFFLSLINLKWLISADWLHFILLHLLSFYLILFLGFQEYSSEKSFVFVAEQSSRFNLDFEVSGIYGYVMLDGVLPSLGDITCTFWMKSADTTNYGTPISYAVENGSDNAFLLTDYNG